MRRHEAVDRVEDLLERRGEVAVVVDVAHELLGEQLLPGTEVEHLELVLQVVGEGRGLDGDGLGVLQLLVLLTGAAHVEAVEKDLLPVDLVVLLLLFLLLLGVGLLRILVLLRLEQLEEGIGEELLLQVLLEVHHGHVEHVHGLIEPRVDPQLLAHRCLL